jgi:hypothetical protein
MPISNVSVMEKPEEEMTVVFGEDFDMPDSH